MTSSCAHFDKPLASSQELGQLAEQFCLSGAGRGRVSVDQNRTLFQYEALLQLDKNQWLLGMTFPVHGEERLDFLWRNHPKTDQVVGRFRGRVVKRWEAESAQSHAPNLFRQSWPEFQRLMALFFSLLKEPQKYCHEKAGQWSCLDPKAHSSAFWTLQMGEKFTAQALLNDEVKLEIESFGSKNREHDRFKIQLTPRVSGPQARPLLTIELFAQACTLAEKDQ